jgi:DNA-binding transcriptional MerR regulator
MDRLSIGKMAKLNGITIDTLRYYDKIGLLKPQIKDEQTSYRYYSIKQSAVLDMIIYMKALGMSLEEIKQHFDQKDLSVMRSVLTRQRESIDAQMIKLMRMKEAVNATINNFDRYHVPPDYGKVVIEHTPKRKIFVFDGGKNIYAHTMEGYEYILRALKNQVIAQELPQVYFCNVGTILRKEMITKGQMYATELFIFLDSYYDKDEMVEYIPENIYLSLYCPSFEKEVEYAQILLDFAKSQNYKIVGDYICEVVVELPIFEVEERHMLIKLQIPVTLG